MAFQVFTGNSNEYDCMPLFLDSSPTSPTNSDNTFRDMLEKYMDLNECQYTTAPPPDQSSSSQTGLQTTILLGRLPWHTRLADMFESGLDFTKEATAALQKDFASSLQQSDENSRAYCAVLRGEIPSNSSSRSYTHVASRLLLIRFLDICCKTMESEETGESDETSKDAAHPQVTLSGLNSIALPDWVDTLKKADYLLKSCTGGHRADNGVELTTTLSIDQLKSRELYIYSERSERTSTLSQIYANIGLGRLDHPQSSEVDDEFGKGLTPPSYGWASLLRTLELAIAAGPLILFGGKKLSNNRIARFRLTTLWVQRGKVTNHSVWFTEKLIWQRLIKIALGIATIEAGVAEIVEMIQKVVYEYVSPAARSWYNLRAPSDHIVEKSRETSEDDFFKFLQMWLPPASSWMPTPLPTLPSTPSQMFMDLPTLTAISTSPLMDVPIQPLSPEAHKDSALALDEVLPAVLEDIHVRDDSFLPTTPPLLASDLDRQSFPQQEEEPEEAKQPPYSDSDRMETDDTSQAPSHHETETTPHDAPSAQANNPYSDSDRMETDDTSQAPSHHETETTPHDAPSAQANNPYSDSDRMETDDTSQAPSHHETETTPHDAPSTQANDLHQGTKSIRAGKRPLQRPASPGSIADAGVDEDMPPPNEKRPRLTVRNTTSRRFKHSCPQASHSQRTSSLGKTADKVKLCGTGPLFKASSFDKMKEVVVRDLTKEYNPAIHNVEGLDTQSNPQKVQGQQSAIFKIAGSMDRYKWAPRFHVSHFIELLFNYNRRC